MAVEVSSCGYPMSVLWSDSTFTLKLHIRKFMCETRECVDLIYFWFYCNALLVVQASMGYKAGEGLGQSGSGIVAPIEESVHKGRRGLGFVLEGLEKEDVHWEAEEVWICLSACLHQLV